MTSLLTEPTSSLPKPPPPRDPTTMRSAVRDASISSGAGKPLMARTVTQDGWASPSWLRALAVISSAARRDSSRSAGSCGRTIGVPVHAFIATGLTVRTVTGACRTAASLRAHSSAREEWADPSMPTVIPDIFCLLLTGLPRWAALNSLSTFVPLTGPGTFGACSGAFHPESRRLADPAIPGHQDPAVIPGLATVRSCRYAQ